MVDNSKIGKRAQEKPAIRTKKVKSALVDLTKGQIAIEKSVFPSSNEEKFGYLSKGLES